MELMFDLVIYIIENVLIIAWVDCRYRRRMIVPKKIKTVNLYAFITMYHQTG